MTNEHDPRPLYGIAIAGGWLTRAAIDAETSATDNPNFAYCYRDIDKAEQAARQAGGVVAELPRTMW